MENKFGLVPQVFIHHSNSDGDGWLETCKCGYPVFFSLSYFENEHRDRVEYWQSIDPIEGNSLREIDECPNCGRSLFEVGNG